MRWRRKPSPGSGEPAARDPAAVLADAVALLHAGLDPESAWRVLGVSTEGDGVPVRGGSAFSADRDVEASVRAAALLARDTGAPLARVLEAIDGALSLVRDARDAAEAALAGPRMSAKILRWLPLVGAALAAGVDPSVVTLLATSPAGWALLAVAGVLTWAGSAWMSRMVRTAAGHRAGGRVPTSVVLALVDAALAAGVPVDVACERVARVVDGSGARALRRLAEFQAGFDRASEAAAPSAEGAPSPSVARTRRRSRAARSRGELDELHDALAGPLALAAHAGAPARFGLRAAMVRLDREQRRRAQRAAGELGVRLTLPLALCLLPSFVLVGVVPLLIAVIAGADLGSLPGLEPPPSGEPSPSAWTR